MPTNQPNWGGTAMHAPAPGSTSTPTNPANNLLTPGNAENFYGDTSSEYKDPSYTEKLVSQGMGGQLNDYYDFANNKLNDQYAAMGGGPSGALLRGSEELRANQAHDMMGYTQAADALHYGRLGAGEGAAATADAGKTGRLSTAFNAANGLGNAEAGVTGGFYGNAASGANPFTAEAINAGVQGSTINPATNAFKDAFSAAGTGAKIYYG
jgi:hypothetical protein